MSDHSASRRSAGIVAAVALAMTITTVPHADAARPEYGDRAAQETTGCVVPDVVGYRLARAKNSLAWSNCEVGRTRYRDAAPRMRGRVLAQSIAPGTIITSSRSVRLTVGS